MSVRMILWAALLAACGGTHEDVGPTCADPARGPAMSRFVPVTGERGLEFQYATHGFQGGALAVVDLDGDERPDIVAARRDGGTMMFRNRGSLQFDQVVESGLDPSAAATAIAAADLDNDGDRDLVLAAAGRASVMANRGDGTFEEVARFADSGTTEHVLPVDVDGDGLLDLYFGNYDLRSAVNTQNRLYLNDTDGGLRFAAGVPAGAGLTWTTTALDVDADGDQDLYVANDTLLADFGTGDVAQTSTHPVDLLLRNDGRGPDGIPIFTDIASTMGLATPRSSMGGVLADFDEDGRLDLYVTDLGANKLFIRDAAGAFVDRAAEFGVAATSRFNERCGPETRSESCLVLSWSAALSDFDLDGYDELLVVNGETTPGDAPPVVLFTRGPDLPYRELSPSLPCMDARGLVVTDLDGDGDQDIVTGHANGPLVVYENRGRPAAETWMRVVLRGTASNRDGVGAVVTVRTFAGRALTRVVGAGGVIHTASPAEAFFGLGSDGAEAIAVRWPSGRRTELARPATGTLLRIDEP